MLETEPQLQLPAAAKHERDAIDATATNFPDSNEGATPAPRQVAPARILDYTPNYTCGESLLRLPLSNREFTGWRRDFYDTSAATATIPVRTAHAHAPAAPMIRVSSALLYLGLITARSTLPKGSPQRVPVLCITNVGVVRETWHQRCPLLDVLHDNLN